MDYIEAFKNLKTNQKWGRKSPHKAILMLTVIELYEKNILMDNEIRYDETLKSSFLKMWNKVIPNDPRFQPDAYFPFWHLQSDNFWHLVPFPGKEDILSLARDTKVRPSEAKLIDSVKYAELDEDLYFLMTLQSGRSSLKRVLLETYTTLSNKEIESLAESKDNTADNSITALSEYEKILSKKIGEGSIESTIISNEIVSQYLSLSEDVQLTLNIVYFTFLKNHRNEREMFKELCPTIYDILDKIVNNPIRQGEISPSFSFIYDNFLSDLKVALLSEDSSIELVDKIEDAIKILRGNYFDSDRKAEESLSFFPAVNENKKEACDEIADTLSCDLNVEHAQLDNLGRVDNHMVGEELQITIKKNVGSLTVNNDIDNDNDNDNDNDYIIAQYLISERTKKALDAKKERGEVTGGTSDKWRESWESKKEQVRKEMKKRGETKNRRHIESRDVQAFIKVLKNVFPLATSEDNMLDWDWKSIGTKDGAKQKIVALMMYYKDIDPTLFRKWNFTDTGSEYLRVKVASYICNLRKAIFKYYGKE